MCTLQEREHKTPRAKVSNSQIEENFPKWSVSGCEQTFLDEIIASTEMYGPIRISVLWEDCNFVGSEANYFIMG